MEDRRHRNGAAPVPKHQQKNRWPADVTPHSDALDLEQRVLEKTSATEIAKSRVERQAKIELLPICDVDVCPPLQPRIANTTIMVIEFH
jgi:hypothetical protein